MLSRENRLRQIVRILEESEEPVSGIHLAEEVDISRQAVVQDIGLLRDRGARIMATSRGYVLRGDSRRRVFAVRHGADEIPEELNTIIEAGGRVLDVVVDHPVYGEIRGNLDLATREDVIRFVNLFKSSGQSPLLSLSNGFHLHTVEAPDEITLDAVENALSEKGFLEA
ncbi:MAG TPA: transcription repressor NadR [Synergistales bacterium]|nr:transcription repressor NadR [Synergistales bacterium]HRV71810.1 transcription repressor NadR [Thermovirgaceae bacterium]